jgi:hypothetical protein
VREKMPLEPELNGYLKIYNLENPNFLLAPINNLETQILELANA